MCQDPVSELVFWYPTGALTADERQQVDAHVADCPICAERLAFATEFRETLRATATHPTADVLVGYVERDPDQSEPVREWVRRHVSECAACAHELDILEQIGDDLATAPTATIGHPSMDTPRPSWQARFRSWAGPGQVAGYLATAAAVTAILITTRGEVDQSRLDRTIMLSSGGSGVRGVVEPASPPSRLAAGESHVLLLEFTDLVEHPMPEAVYEVVIRDADQRVVWRRSVRGETFRDNYTLALVLPAGTLRPGRHAVEVTAPSGEFVLRDRLDVR